MVRCDEIQSEILESEISDFHESEVWTKVKVLVWTMYWKMKANLKGLKYLLGLQISSCYVAKGGHGNSKERQTVLVRNLIYL